ncbi:MAG: FAD-dependent monooxygenase [Candidatus Nanopelagicales bacterium]
MGTTVAIVGAGIGGLSCALAFRQIGLHAQVYEQADHLGEVGAGIGLWPGALRSLAQIGVSPQFWDLPRCTFREAETAAPDGRTLVRFDVSDLSPDQPGFVLRRSDLHRCLVDSLEPGQITVDARVVAVDADAGRLTLADGTRVEADIVIGADGLRSVVRSALFGTQEPRYSGETCYRGMAALRVADTGMLREVQGQGLRCAVHPVDADTVYWWAARRAPAGLVETPAERKAALTNLYAGWHGGLPEALARTPAEQILKNDLFDRPPLRTWSRGRIVLLGDAAHPTTPNLGLGGCMAIEDSLVLARAFRENGDVGAAFAQYQRERESRTRRVVRTSAMFGRLGSFTHPAAVQARELVMKATPAGLAKRQFVREVGYDPGPLHR